jgi:hypothetical protein
MTKRATITDVWTLFNPALLALWWGDECDHCRTSLQQFGALPGLCDVCGADRREGSQLVREMQRRGLDKVQR